MIYEEQLLTLMTCTADFFHQCLPNSPAFGYAQSRHIDQWAIDRFHLGYCPTRISLATSMQKIGFHHQDLLDAGLILAREQQTFMSFTYRFMFPIMDILGRTVGFGARIVPPRKGPKYLNSPETRIYHKSEILYGLHLALPIIREKRRIILVEGYMDIIPLHIAGFTEAVATCGTSISDYQLYLLKLLGACAILLFDGDEAGEKGARRFESKCQSMNIPYKIGKIPNGHDPGSVEPSLIQGEIG